MPYPNKIVCFCLLTFFTVNPVVIAHPYYGTSSIYALLDSLAVAGPESPLGQIRMFRDREQRKTIDAPVFTDPVADLNVIGVRIFGKASSLGLFGREETLLGFSDLEKLPLGTSMAGSHSTILQIS